MLVCCGVFGLWCVVVWRDVLCCVVCVVVLRCVMLCCAVLWCGVLCHGVACCVVLLWYGVWRCSVMCFEALW